MISIISFLIVISICVISHEGGHYLAAKWRSVLVHEFSFGMGPAIWSRQKGETLWSFRVLPIGGYVKLEGEDPGITDGTDKVQYAPARSLCNKKPWERLVIIAAGASVNLVLAWILTAAYLSGYGIYDFKNTTVGIVMEAKPAYTAGLQSGDTIKAIDGVPLNKWADIRTHLMNTKDKNDYFAVTYERRGESHTINIKIPIDKQHGGRLLGVQPAQVKYPITKALTHAFSYSWNMGMEILKGMWMVISGQVKSEVVGPVGIAVIAGDAFKQGFWSFVAFLGIINLHLGLLNLMPFPALDGGRIVFIAAEMVSGRKIPEKFESYAHYAGFILLIALIVLVTGKDLIKLFN